MHTHTHRHTHPYCWVTSQESDWAQQCDKTGVLMKVWDEQAWKEPCCQPTAVHFKHSCVCKREREREMGRECVCQPEGWALDDRPVQEDFFFYQCLGDLPSALNLFVWLFFYTLEPQTRYFKRFQNFLPAEKWYTCASAHACCSSALFSFFPSMAPHVLLWLPACHIRAA